MEKKCYVIGVYPPPYGGATVKCELFCHMLDKKGVQTSKVDVFEVSRKKSKASSVFKKCIEAFRSEAPIVYCLDSKRLKAVILLQKLFKKSFKRTTILVIGGVFHETVAEDTAFEKVMKQVKGIWVETEGMREKLNQRGFRNVEVFPNPKSEQGSCVPRIAEEKRELKLVFFSQISKEKGVELIIKLVELLDENEILYQLDFYGHVVPQFKNEFEKFIARSQRVKYCGVFDSTKSSVYKKLNNYDILLFPTKWKGEGVPGILVEAKMAGLAVIASPMNFNKEIIREKDKEGFLLEKQYPEEMMEIIKKCSNNYDLLNQMKQGSYQSRKRYALEEYENMIELLNEEEKYDS